MKAPQPVGCVAAFGFTSPRAGLVQVVIGNLQNRGYLLRVKGLFDVVTKSVKRAEVVFPCGK